MRKLENLKPERVFYYFEELSQIPRESGNEKAVSDFLVEFGKKLNFYTYQDENNNVIIRRPASKGMEDHPGVILQGHMDMVCEKEKDSNHDFLKDPIDLVVDGNLLKANKTTLGGDNGIALAMAMAILEDETIKAPMIEMLATTSEETDLGGAMALKPGLLEGKMLINIDSEDEGRVTVGSAGGINLDITIPLNKKEVEGKFITTIELSDLTGGHSGVEINQNRGNANKYMVELLDILAKDIDFDLSKITGGSKDNAIPRVAEAILVTDEDITSEVNDICAKIKAKYIETEPKMQFAVSMDTDKKIEVMALESKKTYMEVVTNLPTGVNTWMKEYPEIVESSDNLAIIETREDCVYIIISLRSSDPIVLKSLQDKMEDILKGQELTYNFNGDYPEWNYKPDSVLRDKALELYKKMYNEDMIVEVIHAGLECGAISHNYPDLDYISIGPNLRDVHTPQEQLEIDSTQRVYEYVVELVKSL